MDTKSRKTSLSSKNPPSQHKQKREEFYALAMSIAAMIAKTGRQNEAFILKEKVDEMKRLEQHAEFPKASGMKVNLN